jgi:hypothetical protein
VIKAAAENEKSGKEIITLLLDHKENTIENKKRVIIDSSDSIE